MQWFYEQNGQQRGPVDEAHLRQLVHQGVILPQTLIWNSTMQNWQAYGEIQMPEVSDSEKTKTIEFETDQENTIETKPGFSSDSTVRCQKCGKFFPRIQLADAATGPICPACQVNPIQTENDSAVVIPEFQYAGFGVRLMAQFLDGFVSMLLFIVPLFVGLRLGIQNNSLVVFYLIALLLFIITYTVIVNKIGASPGKAMLGIRVVNTDGSPIGSGRASGRWWVAQILLGLTMGISHLIVVFDPQKRALHDYIFNTRVIYINK